MPRDDRAEAGPPGPAPSVPTEAMPTGLLAPGQVVPKTRLIDEVWQTEFIAESALTRAVGELRRALGESAREQRYLETITKCGYS